MRLVLDHQCSAHHWEYGFEVLHDLPEVQTYPSWAQSPSSWRRFQRPRSRQARRRVYGCNDQAAPISSGSPTAWSRTVQHENVISAPATLTVLGRAADLPQSAARPVPVPGTLLTL